VTVMCTKINLAWKGLRRCDSMWRYRYIQVIIGAVLEHASCAVENLVVAAS